MSEKVENGGDCGEDDDEWRDLIATPNRLISDEFFTLKSEKLDDRENDEGKEVQEQVSSMEGRVRSSRVSIAERRAAMRCSDVNASRINVSVSSSRVTAWPPSVTIPSGSSPTSLLDSPIMLPNSQVSPTTGSFPYPPLTEEMSAMNSEVQDMSCDAGSFMYQNHGGSLIWPDQNVNDQPPLMYEFPKETIAKEPPTELDSSHVFKVPKSTIKSGNGAVQLQSSHTDNKDDTKRYQETTLSNMRNSEDGYNWRKYGQKQVKGSEYPRSYYKCTHPNCLVKKKVERSLDGHITEIIYKGAHNHQGHRNINGSPDANGSFIKIGEGEKWGNGNNIRIRPEWTSDRMNLSSSTSFADNNSDVKSQIQGKFVGMYESAGNRDLSPSNPNYDCNEEDGTNIGTDPPGDDADDDKSDLRRRKKGNYLLETSLVTRAMREPRVVVQIESEVDILDDGYRWRKYGQKVVKGNPNPRSYYKCTSTGCPVRKHVERASDDLKSVLTTYEGKHNHEVPAARNSNHATVDAGPTTNTPTLRLSRINNIPKSEPQDLPIRFDRKITNGYIPSNYVPNFETKPTKFEPSSMYQTEYMPYQNPIFNGSVLPDFPISLPMTMPPSGNMVHNFGFNNNGKRARDCEAQSFIGHGQHLRDNNGRFIKPKVEQDNGFYDTFMCAPDHVNDAASRYCRVIPNFPS